MANLFHAEVSSPLQGFLQAREVGRGLKAKEDARVLAAADAEALAGAPRNLQAIQELMYSRPHMAKQLQPILDSMGENERKRTIEQAYRVSEGLKSGNTEFLLKSLQDEHLKYQRSGMADAAGDVMETIRQIEQNPKMALTAAEAALLANDPERFGTVMETPSKIASREGEEARKQGMYGLDVAEKSLSNYLLGQDVLSKEQSINKIKLENKKLEKEIEQMADRSGKIPSNKVADVEMRLAGEYDRKAKDFVEITKSFNNLQAAANDPSGADDLAIVFSFMKMLDPGVAVMEGDVRNVTNTSSKMNQAIATFKRIYDDKKFGSDTERKNFIATARKFYDNGKSALDVIKRDYEAKADRYGLNKDNIISSDIPLYEAPKQDNRPKLPAGAKWID